MRVTVSTSATSTIGHVAVPRVAKIGAVCAGLALSAVIAVGCGSGSGFAAICRSPDEDVHATKTTATHIFGLSVTGPEITHTVAQVRVQHIKHGGDVLLAGRLVTTPVSPSGSPHHFELHVCDAKTGKVLSGLHPAMKVADTRLGPAFRPIAVATMEGTGEGSNDLHYGNEVLLLGGHSYAVTVEVARDRAILPIHESR